MLTKWGERLDRERPLPEYPRPQMVRESYVNLNGLWDCAFSLSAETPRVYEGQIVVPFSPEAPLSGVGRPLGRTEVLHYRRIFTLPAGFRRGRVLLHFGAVDQTAEVRLNGKPLGSHEGGYWPFTFDCTDALVPGENELTVSVRDDPEDPCRARGKQSLRPGGIWYTAQSGIWQTVWLESVPEVYIKSLRITPEYDESRVRIELETHGTAIRPAADVYVDGEFVAGSWFRGNTCVIPLEHFRSWSPEDPFLYGLRITFGEDVVKSYFGMRKFSYAEYRGRRVFALNNRPYLHNGLLDQGYWPDGLLTPPDDEAFLHDLRTAKDCGFNMLRKHIKIEPLRWYYHCDRLGLLVWQDMVSGGGVCDKWTTSYLPLAGAVKLKDANRAKYGREAPESRARYKQECRDTLALLYNCPCIALWTPFNEGWGQFDALHTAATVRRADPSRYIDHASGWQDQGWPDIQSRHIYFRPIRLKNDGRALCLTEFGGYTLALPGHMWCEEPFGYKRMPDGPAFAAAYRALFEGQVIPHIEKEGLTAAVYTQLSDVEQEMNGLMTYDRRVLKIDPAVLREINRKMRFT